MSKSEIDDPKAKVQEFAAPGTYGRLLCRGRHCAKCGKCRDWYYTGDLETWNWIRNCNNWEGNDLQRYLYGRVWARFKYREGATCRLQHTDLDDIHHVQDADGSACICEDNIKS